MLKQGAWQANEKVATVVIKQRVVEPYFLQGNGNKKQAYFCRKKNRNKKKCEGLVFFRMPECGVVLTLE